MSNLVISRPDLPPEKARSPILPQTQMVSSAKVPALATDQMVEVDRLMIEVYGILLIQMMENAGRNFAELTRRILGGNVVNRQIIVLCGAGNNGGGGMVAARHLHNWGARVSVTLVSSPDTLKETPLIQWRSLTAMGLGSNADPQLDKADMILDSLIGYGLSGDPRPPIAAWINAANHSGRPVLSLDAPSGLDTTTGKPGTPCIQAAATLALALLKTGLLATQAKPYVGDLYLADIGVPGELYQRLGVKVPPLFTGDTILKID